MRKLWAEEDVEYEGNFHRVEGGTMSPRPAQKPGVPLWFGGNSEVMQRRLAGIADGWVGPGGAPADNFVAGVKRVREFAGEHGRDPDSLGFGKLINVSIDPSRERAFDLARAHWNTYYGPNFNVERSAICGEPDAVGAALREFGEAETPEVTLILEPSNLDLDQLRLLAETMGVTSA